MAFAYEPNSEKYFKDYSEVYDWVEKEQKNLNRIPMKGFLKHNAQFIDDKHFGDEQTYFTFNQNGIRSICSILGIPLNTLDLLERENLVTEVLNDLLAQQVNQRKLKSKELIVDEENTIIGLVSESYLGYSNLNLLQNLDKLINLSRQQPLFPEASDFLFKEAYSINTQMSIRFTMVKKVGIVKGLGGKGKDITELGIQLKNSMVGDSSININYYLHRKVCANGLIVPAGSSENRVIHAGKENNFQRRLATAFKSVTDKVGQNGKMLENLAELEFNPELLARASCSKMIFGIIPGSKEKLSSQYRLTNTTLKTNKKQEKINREAALIGFIPGLFCGKYSSKVFDSPYRDNASMFDFINIFTEHAQTMGPSKKIEAEEKAGALANWITNNKKKFKSLS